MAENTHRPQDSPLTYKVLLVLTTLSSIVFCWLYVTKPAEIVADQKTILDSPNPISSAEAETTINSMDTASEQNRPSQKPTDFLPPSMDFLPDKGSQNASIKATSPASTENPIELPNSASTKGNVAFEETNDRIQHVITAQNGDKSERIILDVPVIYQTRGLRLGPAQAEEARRILRALKSYKSLVEKLQQDGKNISKAWELLLMDCQPIDALRADSPSLPTNSADSPNAPTEKSSQTISIESTR